MILTVCVVVGVLPVVVAAVMVQGVLVIVDCVGLVSGSSSAFLWWSWCWRVLYLCRGLAAG